MKNLANKYVDSFIKVDETVQRNEKLEIQEEILDGQLMYKCYICDFVSAHKSSIKRHIRLHTEKNKYQCEVCFKFFNDKVNLSKHILQQHFKYKPFKCPVCTYTNSQNINLTNHIIHNHKGVNAFKCCNCDYFAPNKDDLKIHSKVCKKN